MGDVTFKPTAVKVEDFLDAVEPARKRDDAYTLLRLMKKLTGEKATMWGPSVVGFGTVHYKYDSGREGDMCLAGFSPRKANLVVYMNRGFDVSCADLLEKLGKYKGSVCCLYINKLADVDLRVLERLIRRSIRETKKQSPRQVAAR